MLTMNFSDSKEHWLCLLLITSLVTQKWISQMSYYVCLSRQRGDLWSSVQAPGDPQSVTPLYESISVTWVTTITGIFKYQGLLPSTQYSHMWIQYVFLKLECIKIIFEVHIFSAKHWVRCFRLGRQKTLGLIQGNFVHVCVLLK